MTTTGSRTCRLARLSVLAAPVSCSAIRKSEAWRTPAASPFFIGTMVGRPAPAQSAMWSKPSAKALSMVSVPPKRTPPNILNSRRRSSSRRMSLRKFLSQRTVMPYSATPPNPAMTRASSGSRSSATSRIGAERHPRAARIDAGNILRQRLDLEPVDGHHGVAVVHQVMREREAGRPQPDHQHLAAGRGLGQRPAQIERVPARQQRIDLEAPGQRQHVLEHAGLDLRNVDRLLLLVDAGLHAVVADAVAGGRAHRVVDDRDGERAERVALGLRQVHLGDFLVERTAGEHDAERALLELAGLFLAAPSSSCPCPGCGTRCSSWRGRARR